MGATLHNPLLSNGNDSVTMGQTDILRGYLMERRRALRMELANLDRLLGYEAQTGKRSSVGNRPDRG